MKDILKISLHLFYGVCVAWMEGHGDHGTYIGQIYTEVKRRPLYHIAEILE